MCLNLIVFFRILLSFAYDYNVDLITNGFFFSLRIRQKAPVWKMLVKFNLLLLVYFVCVAVTVSLMSYGENR